MKFKLTSLEKKWVLYDVGNSAFTMMVSTIFPIYFNYLAGNAGISDVDYLAYWGYATSVCTLLVAILGPTLGAIADTKNFKKTVFFVAMGVGVFGCILLGFLSSWIWFLGIFVLAKTGYSASLIFYDAMLTDVTDPERMDAVSSHGYAWGYIGSCIPFVACLGVVLGAKPLGIGMQTAMIIAFIITALWWLLSSVPLLRSYRQKYFAEVNGHVVKDSFKRLGKTFAELVKEKHIFVFLLAFFFYIDGVYTVIDMATAYGQALGLDSTGLLLALLVTQIVAFPSVLIFGRIVKKVVLGKETIDSYNQSENRGAQTSHGLNYQKLGKELMSQDEIATMDGGKCILQVRGVRPFFSEKYDITRHPRYQYLSDADKQNTFDVDRYLSSLRRKKRRVVSEDETFDLYDIDLSDEDLAAQ